MIDRRSCVCHCVYALITPLSLTMGAWNAAGEPSAHAAKQGSDVPAPCVVPWSAKPKTIDARTDDWEDMLRSAVHLTSRGTVLPRSDDLDVQVAFAADAVAFYGLLEVRDDEIAFPKRAWRYGDGFYITFAEPTEEFASNRFITFGLSNEGGRPRAVVVNRDGEYFPKLGVSSLDLAIKADAKTHQLVYEFAIPWALLTPLQPLVDETWGLNLIYVDRDGDQRQMVMLRGDLNFDTERTDLRRTLPIRFELPDPKVRAVQFRAVRTHVTIPNALPIALGILTPDALPQARLEWTIRAAGLTGGNRGSRAVEVKAGHTRVRLEIPVRDVPSGPATVQLVLRNGEEKIADAQLPLMVFDQRKLERDAAALDGKLTAMEAAAQPTGVATAQFYLERVRRFAVKAAPADSTDTVQTDWEELQRALTDLHAGVPVFAERRGVFRHAHRSKIDDTLQPYSVAIPRTYDARTEYPLFVVLHGSGVDERQTIRWGASVIEGMDWIVLAPRGRGLSDWYQGDSGRDVFECVADVQRRYSIDPARIVLQGFSMGGFGAWRLGLQRPELFAGVAVMSGALRHGSEDLAPLLETVRGLPLFVVHGTADNAVSVEEARRAVTILQGRNYPAIHYRELAGAAHGSYYKLIREDLRTWLQAR